MRRTGPPPQLPTATELAHAPELAILIALDTLLEMTTVTLHLSIPELDLIQPGHPLPDLDSDDRDLVVAQDILDLADALKRTIHLYRTLSLRS